MNSEPNPFPSAITTNKGKWLAESPGRLRGRMTPLAKGFPGLVLALEKEQEEEEGGIELRTVWLSCSHYRWCWEVKGQV